MTTLKEYNISGTGRLVISLRKTWGFHCNFDHMLALRAFTNALRPPQGFPKSDQQSPMKI